MNNEHKGEHKVDFDFACEICEREQATRLVRPARAFKRLALCVDCCLAVTWGRIDLDKIAKEHYLESRRESRPV